LLLDIFISGRCRDVGSLAFWVLKALSGFDQGSAVLRFDDQHRGSSRSSASFCSWFPVPLSEFPSLFKTYTKEFLISISTQN
jgi:hypothetical protein